MTPRISILIPIYNVQLYIERCVRSLMEQTFQDLEYIFVDDASTDCSLSILKSVIEEYPDRKYQIHIINHTENQGVAAARNTALSLAKGEYIFWCDSDDWVDLEYCSTVYNFAISHNSDLVICDFYHEYDNRTELETFKEFKTFQSLIDNPRDCWWGVYCRFMRRAFIEENHILFYPQIDMWEDLGFSVRLHYYAKHITYLHEPYYHYNRINSSSILNQSNKFQSGLQLKYHEQRLECIRLITEFLQSKHLSSKLFYQKARMLEVDTVLVWGEIERLNTTFRDLMPLFIRRTELTLPYRLAVCSAMLGFMFPLRIYRYLSSLRRNSR